MIYTDTQFHISSAELERLKAALLDAKFRKVDQAWLKQAEIEALESQIEEIEEELLEYEQLRTGKLSFPKIQTIEELRMVLAKARILAGLSQNVLAEKLKMSAEQVQRYEATNYMGVSLGLLLEISRTLKVEVPELPEGYKHSSDSIFEWGEVDNFVWSEFPLTEIVKRKWFELSPKENPHQKLREYFFQVINLQPNAVYNRSQIRSRGTENRYALLAWRIRVLQLAQEQMIRGKVAEFDLNDSWLPELVHLTRAPNGASKACELLAENGIVCIIERNLSGSHLDGAAMLDSANRPVIGLTLRYDRLDNFWFVLFHELGHVFLHLTSNRSYDFFDQYDVLGGSAIETEADEFALNSLIPKSQWNQCMSRFALSEESVRIDAANLNIDPSIIAGRIRREQDNYRILSDLVGQGKVRVQFEETKHGTD